MHGVEAWEELSGLHRRSVEAAALVTSVSRYTRRRLLKWVGIDPARDDVLLAERLEHGLSEVARFEENYSGAMGVDLDVQTTRIYPNGPLAEDVLGYVRLDNSSVEDEDAFFNYRLPDYSGVVGI